VFLDRLIDLGDFDKLNVHDIKIQYFLSEFFLKISTFLKKKFSNNDFIGAGLGGMAIVVGCTKRQFQTTNLLEVNFKLKFKKKHFTSCNILHLWILRY